MIAYHVTFTKNLAKVFAEGLTTGRKPTWDRQAGGSNGDRDKVYLFTDLRDALRWAVKQAFDHDKPTAIVQVKINPDGLTRDENFQMRLDYPSSAWVRMDVPAHMIAGAINPTPSLVAKVCMDRQTPTDGEIVRQMREILCDPTAFMHRNSIDANTENGRRLLQAIVQAKIGMTAKIYEWIDDFMATETA